MQVTAVEPTGKQSPECTTLPVESVQVIVVEPPQLSLAFTVKEAAAHVAGAHVLTVMGLVGEEVIEGPVVSLTVMVCVYLATFPHVSIAVQHRVMTLLQLDPGLDSFTTGVIEPWQP